MKKETCFYKFLNRVYHFALKILRIVFKPLLFLKHLFLSKKYNLVLEPKSFFKNPIIISPSHYEKRNLPDVFKVSKDRIEFVYSPEIYSIIIPNATIFENSDIVISNRNVVWAKKESTVFSKTTPDDYNVISFDKNSIRVGKNRKSVKISGDCFSILGQFDYIWSHFLMQCLPKLIIGINKGLIKRDTTIIIPDCKDQNILDAIAICLKAIPEAKLIQAKKGVSYCCGNLIYLSPVSQYSDQCKYVIPEDSFLPDITIQALYNGLISPILKEKQAPNTPQKLYLIRRNAMRTLKNWNEIEDFFKSEGFYLIEPHKFSLTDKINMFYNSKEVVGPYSSAFYNVCFCNNAKVLVFSNFSRTVEISLPELASIGHSKMLFVTGDDENASGVQSSYTISLERIKSAYFNFCKS